MKGPNVWLSVGDAAWLRIRRELGRHFSLVLQERHVRTARCFETFDWRLWRRGWVLLSTMRPRCLRLEDLEDLDPAAEEPLPVDGMLAWRDLPPGALRERLQGACGPRILLPMGAFRELQRVWELRDGERQTVCRLLFSQANARRGNERGPVRAVAHILPLKGHPQAARTVRRCLTAAGCKGCVDREHAALLAFASVRRTPGDYSAKPKRVVTAAMTAAEACRRIHRECLTVMRRNLPGLLADLDPEFLHDFRVGLRRSRSALSLLGGVFPRDAEERFRRDLATIQRATGPLRDLDVHRLEHETFAALLPPELHPGLRGLFETVARERAAAVKSCHAFLQQPTTQAVWLAWTSFLETPCRPADPTAPHARDPAGTLGRHFLRKRFRRVLRAGRAITPDAPEGAWHALRIQVKKLRYGLDFFAGLLPAGEAVLLEKRLRALQAALGKYNDLCTQEAWVRRKLDETLSAPVTSQPLAASLGGLLTELRRARRQQQARLRPAFLRLDCPKVRRGFRNGLKSIPLPAGAPRRAGAVLSA